MALNPVSIAGTPLERYFHVCAFFDSRDQEYAVLGSYYQEGLAAGEKCLHIVAPELCDEHRARLAHVGIDVGARERSGQLDITTPTQTYLDGGEFSPDKMIGRVDRVIAAARERGFPRTRIMGNMSWAQAKVPGSERLVEYETRVNEVLARTRQPAVCVYDAAQLTGSMMLDILRCHPLTLVNGVVQENPFFTPPEVFLEELRTRARRIAAS